MQTEGQRNQDKCCTNNWSSLKQDVIDIQKCIIPQSALWKLFEAEWESYDFSFLQSLHSVLFYKLQLLVQRFCFSALLSVHFCTAFSIRTMKLVFASHSGPGCNALWAHQVISLLLPIYVSLSLSKTMWFPKHASHLSVKFYAEHRRKRIIHNLCILLVLPRFYLTEMQSVGFRYCAQFCVFGNKAFEFCPLGNVLVTASSFSVHV